MRWPGTLLMLLYPTLPCKEKSLPRTFQKVKSDIFCLHWTVRYFVAWSNLFCCLIQFLKIAFPLTPFALFLNRLKYQKCDAGRWTKVWIQQQIWTYRYTWWAIIVWELKWNFFIKVFPHKRHLEFHQELKFNFYLNLI